jgi:hypothetical protein
MLSIKRRPRGAIVSVAACAAGLLLFAAPASAATEVYPSGGGAFAAGEEGWQVTDEVCTVAILCTTSGEHDPSAGNPPGSMTAKTNIAINLLSLFGSTVAFESPEFTVDEGTAAVLRADRQFIIGGLVDLGPQADYSVTLVDVTDGVEVGDVTELLAAESASFVNQTEALTVTPGHTYLIEVEVATTSTTISILADGATDVRFDNVALTVETPDPPVDPPVDPPTDPGDGGKDGSDGKDGKDDSSSNSTSTKNSSSSDQGTTQQVTTTGIVQNGRRVRVKLSCPKRAKKACRITAQGKLGGKRVTQRRTVKVGKGKNRVVALRVKPRFREVVAKRKRLLIVQKVKTGKRTRTFTRSRSLIQPG